MTSAAATLTVNAAAVAPTITTQPVNQTVTAGQTATFTVVAGRDGAAQLPVAEERGEHRGGDGDELHDAGNGDDRQRIDVRCGGEQHGGDGDQRGGHADGECGGSGADDHDAAGEPDGDGGTTATFTVVAGRDSAARLPVAEERSEHRGSDGDELHDASNSDDRQRIDVRVWW